MWSGCLLNVSTRKQNGMVYDKIWEGKNTRFNKDGIMMCIVGQTQQSSEGIDDETCHLSHYRDMGLG